MRRKIGLKSLLPYVVSGICIVFLYISMVVTGMNAERTWERAGGVRMRIDIESLSVMGFSQQDGWLQYYYNPQGIQLQVPAGWNIDQDTWEQPFRLEATELHGNAKIYVYLSRNPKDFSEGAMSKTLLDAWKVTTAQQETRSINERDWQIIDGTCERQNMNHCRLYTTNTDYWGMAVLYLAAEEDFDEAMIAHVTQSVDLYKNYDNVEYDNVRGDPLIQSISEGYQLPEWHPLETLKEGLAKAK